MTMSPHLETLSRLVREGELPPAKLRAVMAEMEPTAAKARAVLSDPAAPHDVKAAAAGMLAEHHRALALLDAAERHTLN
jgi:hypothetical protein